MGAWGGGGGGGREAKGQLRRYNCRLHQLTKLIKLCQPDLMKR